MSEDYLIRHCAPTLAGIKTANLFTCPYRERKDLLSFIRKTNRKLIRKGLRVLPLRFTEEKALIYVYRPGKLAADLSDSTAASILHSKGYCTGNCEKCIGQLARKIRCEAEFPHEIGLFLGYPPEDVNGFIINRGGGYKWVGNWKVYGDEEAAKKTCEKYKKCTDTYRSMFASGKTIMQLTVEEHK